MNQCSNMIASPDPRAFFKSTMLRSSTSSMRSMSLDLSIGFPMRQEDSDDPRSRYRLWEVAGASHSWLYQNGFNVTASGVTENQTIEKHIAACAGPHVILRTGKLRARQGLNR
ncbi:alpha/beta hydrolase domain-containing protein [Rhizobium leguminosarum]|uniref:alpha/beta hydrolase domain-containing protein n=1 Tax=Rhizobium leguminosarum TaxID=384 RepID=UPI003D7C2B28